MSRYRVQGTHLVVGDQPQIPVMGEAHFSRIPRDLWPQVLAQLRSLGVTIVSSYVFWNHHQPDPDRPPSFSGQLDLAEFIRQARAHGLDFSLRIGPWVHGESRYGGLPDWVATGPWRTRTDDPDYLQVVADWFTALGQHIDGLELSVLQIENELYDQPEHLLTLKKLARSAELRADLTTATGWGGAQFDRSEFLPVYGGYPDTFWSAHSLGWESLCAIHYRFQAVRDDALIGADGRTSDARQPVDDSALPYATCELGGGMTTSYHRRPHIQAADVGALGISKIGCGSVWQGWYMMVGGMNPLTGDHALNESLETGYPNELPLRDYDFTAPIGSAGQLRDSAHLLRLQHAMLATLGSGLARSEVILSPDGRSAIRRWPSTDGTPPHPALVLFNQHQPHTDLGRRTEVQFTLPDQTRVPPRPVTIAVGEFGAWAANLDLGHGVRLVSSDLMPITRLDHPTPIWVFAQTIADSISAEIATDRGPEPLSITPGIPIEIRGRTGCVRLLVLDRTESATAWPIAGRFFLSAAPLIATPDGIAAICDPATADAPIRELTPTGIHTVTTCPGLSTGEIPLEYATEADHPDQRDDWSGTLIATVQVPPTAHPLDRISVHWRGNVLRIVPAGSAPDTVSAVLADQFWHGGGELTLAVAHLGGHGRLDLHVTGFGPGEVLVAGQPATRGIDSVTLHPVTIHLFTGPSHPGESRPDQSDPFHPTERQVP